MIFTLKIYKDAEKNNEEDELINTFENVDISWVANTCMGEATQNGVRVAIINTYDDYPIEIMEDCVIISGVIIEGKEKDDKYPYGYWRLHLK
jgi:hypothetical protein